MINKMFQHLRHSPVIRLKIKGPINRKSQQEITERLNRIQNLKSDALLVVVNSYGGSIQSAKNISARIKKYADNIQTPVYCFAQQFCLNSANLILTSGTRCYAHKFSVIGDFGYVYQGYDTTQLQKMLNIKQDHVSSMKVNYKLNPLKQDSIFYTTNQKIVQKILKQSQEDLKRQIFKNRLSNLSIQQQNSFINNLEVNSSEQNRNGNKQSHDLAYMNVKKGVQIGLIDGVQGIQQFILEQYKHHRLIQQTGEGFYHPVMQWMRSWKDNLIYREK